MNSTTFFWLAGLALLYLWWKDRQKQAATAEFSADTTPKGQANPSGAPDQVTRTPRTMEEVTTDVKRLLMERTAL